MITKEKRFETILAITFGMLVLYYIFHAKIFLTLAAVFSGIGLFSAFFGGLITKFWLKFAAILGVINGKILLSVIFFIILTPVAFLMKLAGKTALIIGKKSGDTIYTERNHEYVSADFENTW